MLWIGLTGGIASGKSTVAGLWSKSGIPIIDADALAQAATRPHTQGWREICKEFGQFVDKKTLVIDRKALGDYVFNNPVALAKLESILHPLVQAQVQTERETLRQQRCRYAVYMVPLLFEKKMQNQFDAIVLVGTSPEQQVERLEKRNQLSRDQALSRINNQIPLQQKQPLCTWYIDNSRDLLDLNQQAQKVLEKIDLFCQKFSPS